MSQRSHRFYICLPFWLCFSVFKNSAIDVIITYLVYFFCSSMVYNDCFSDCLAYRVFRSSVLKELMILCLLFQLSIFLIPFKLIENVMKLDKLLLLETLANSSVIYSFQSIAFSTILKFPVPFSR